MPLSHELTQEIQRGTAFYARQERVIKHIRFGIGLFSKADTNLKVSKFDAFMLNELQMVIQKTISIKQKQEIIKIEQKLQQKLQDVSSSLYIDEETSILHDLKALVVVDDKIFEIYQEKFIKYIHYYIDLCMQRFKAEGAGRDLDQFEQYINDTPQDILSDDLKQALKIKCQEAKALIDGYQSAEDKINFVSRRVDQLKLNCDKLEQKILNLTAAAVQGEAQKEALSTANADLAIQNKKLEETLVALKTAIDLEKKEFDALKTAKASFNAECLVERGKLTDEIQRLKLEQASLCHPEAIAVEKAKLDALFTRFEKEILQVNGKKHPEAKHQATELLASLRSLAKVYFKTERTDKDRKVFQQGCKDAIDLAMPTLESALGWAEKLLNLLKSIIKAITNASHSGFFQSGVSKEARVLKDSLPDVISADPSSRALSNNNSDN